MAAMCSWLLVLVLCGFLVLALVVCSPVTGVWLGTPCAGLAIFSLVLKALSLGWSGVRVRGVFVFCHGVAVKKIDGLCHFIVNSQIPSHQVLS